MDIFILPGRGWLPDKGQKTTNLVHHEQTVGEGLRLEEICSTETLTRAYNRPRPAARWKWGDLKFFFFFMCV